MNNNFKVLDSDMHIMEPPDLWERYIDPKYREYAPRMIDVDGQQRWFFEGRVFPAYSGGGIRRRLITKRTSAGDEGRKGERYRSARERQFDGVAQLEAMDNEGIDVAVCFRTYAGHLIAVDGLDPSLAAAVASGFNRWLFDHCSPDRERLKVGAIVALQDPNLAVEEAHRAVAEYDARTLIILTNPTEGRPLYHPDYDILWETAQELDVAVAFHGIQAAYQEHVANRYIDNLPLSHGIAQPMELIFTLGSLVLGGILERFPRLRVALLEGNCAWLPWWLYRMEEEMELFGHTLVTPLALEPKEYFVRQCYISVDPDEALVKDVVDYIGDDNIVISSDWPHDDAMYPDAMNTFIKTVDVPDGTKKKILWDNCARLYKL